MHGTGQARTIRNTVKSIGHEYKVSWVWHQCRKLVSIAYDEIAIRQASFAQALTGHVRQKRIYVDGNDMTCNFGDLQRKPTITGAEINHNHPGRDADGREDPGRIRPQGFPPSGIGHFGALKKSRNSAAHRSPSPRIIFRTCCI
jgi:hypothetical protein